MFHTRHKILNPILPTVGFRGKFYEISEWVISHGSNTVGVIGWFSRFVCELGHSLVDELHLRPSPPKDLR